VAVSYGLAWCTGPGPEGKSLVLCVLTEDRRSRRGRDRRFGSLRSERFHFSLRIRTGSDQEGNGLPASRLAPCPRSSRITGHLDSLGYRELRVLRDAKSPIEHTKACNYILEM